MEDRGHEISFTEKESDFLRFLLTASNTSQSVLLIKNTTASQTNAFGEICMNILYSEDLDKELLESLRKYKGLVRQLGDRTVSLNARRQLIREHPKKLLNILKLTENILPI